MDHGSLFDTETEDAVLNNGKHDPVPVVATSVPTKSVPPDPLAERRKIEDSIKNAVLRTLPTVESDQQQLEETARNTLKLLNGLEQEFFGFSVREGMVVPDHPEHWSIKEGESLVFMRDGE